MKNKIKIFSIPNIMSLLRIALIPFIIITYRNNQTILSFFIIIFSGLTDIADGFIARRFNMITPLGKALDPIADKLTIGSILLMLSYSNKLILGLLFIFIIKEVFMAIEGLIVISQTGTTYSSKWYGKLSTFILYFTLVTIILFKNISSTILWVLIAICVVFVLLSFVLYTISNSNRIKEYNMQQNNA